MSSKFSALLQSSKLLFLLIGLSLLILIMGILLISRTPDMVPEAVSPSAEQQEDLSLIKSLNDTETIINNASKNDAPSLTDEQREIRGSEEWCEAMMVKPDAEWSDADARLFAQKCLND